MADAICDAMYISATASSCWISVARRRSKVSCQRTGILVAQEVEQTAVVHELGDDEHGLLRGAHAEQLHEVRMLHLQHVGRCWAASRRTPSS